jgi:hypothetical protein
MIESSADYSTAVDIVRIVWRDAIVIEIDTQAGVVVN